MHALFPSEATSGNVKTIMKRHFKEWWSTIPSISTKLTTTWNYWTERKPRYMTLEINVLARDRQIQWRGLINLSMRCQPYPLDNWMSNVNIDIIVCYVSHYMLFGTCMSKFCLFTLFYWKFYQWAKKLRYRFVNCYSFKWHLYEWLFLYWNKYMCTEIKYGKFNYVFFFSINWLPSVTIDQNNN
jgi:hypothetical protein